LDVKTRFKGGKATAKIIKSGASLAGWDDALSLEAKIELIIKEPYTKRYTIWRTILACQENIKWFANEQSEKFPETAITQHFELLALSSQRMQDCLKAEGFSLHNKKKTESVSYLGDFANTYKHIKRKKMFSGGLAPRSGRILKIISEGRRISEFTLAFASEDSLTIDIIEAFQLVDDAIEDWRKIFASLNLSF